MKTSKIFNRTQGQKLSRSAFNLSHERKLSCNMGELIPIFCQEVIPGDTFRVNSEIMMRLAPMQAPIMHRCDVTTHFFYVPNRLVWNQPDFEKWITGGQPGDEIPLYPRIRINDFNLQDPNIISNVSSGSLWDYLGLPNLADVKILEGSLDVSALPFRAYVEIWNEYYRDQDLQERIEYDKGSGIIGDEREILKITNLLKRCWEKDYFTSARPWAQKGDEVTLPIGDAAEVKYDPESPNNPFLVAESDTNFPPLETLDGRVWQMTTDNSGKQQIKWFNGDETYGFDPNGSLFADLSQATATTINELRRAFQLQKFLERNARSGTRYTEMLLAHFGVKSSDARINRPEYLGGGRQPISISEVLQMSQTSESSPQGEMTGHGISVGKSNRFKRFFEEHGFVIGIMSVLPRTSYQQGIPRQFTKFDRFDHYWKEFEHIGEQEIKNKELFLSQFSKDRENVFGYAPRYSEYKYIPSSVHGDMKGNLSHWHLGRIFGNQPSLNSDFVQANPSQRIFNVVDENVHKLWVHIYNDVKAVRPMSVFSNPGSL